MFIALASTLLMFQVGDPHSALDVLITQMERVRQEQTRHTAEKRASAERSREYIDSYNAFAARIDQCFVKDYLAGKVDKKRCSRDAIRESLEKFLSIASPR